MTERDAQDFHINPFDLTKVWSHADIPLIEIGQLELNRNVDNYFAETEQAAFAPSNLVPGIGASPDKMLQARLFAYQDAQRYRIGANVNQLPVNAPRCPVNHYQRDAAMAGMKCPYGHDNNQGSGVNFYPNDQKANGAPVPAPDVGEPPMPILGEAWVKAYDTSGEDYYSQAGALYGLMNESQKQQLVDNITGGLIHANISIQQRMVNLFRQVDEDYANRVDQALTSMEAVA